MHQNVWCRQCINNTAFSVNTEKVELNRFGYQREESTCLVMIKKLMRRSIHLQRLCVIKPVLS